MVNVIKADGTRESYNRNKVLDSIKRAGIPESLNKLLIDEIERDLYEDVTTYKIYKHIEDFLGKSDEKYLKGRYSLKQSIMQLGPTGYPFETYVAEVLKTHKI
ncbi:MAG: ATP-cone domain protein [Candidatus Woesebacteria bacterium GW2011_GWB1_38_5b]|uniref:ATP-cone domain protein n=1 Tax=Candidatus Woesebacteria bacterium GW2011_GWB1_38_5b TaxID=1618569 RepID=A0A0G0MKB1_9BACT|nr:MAG: ATP-cone domain protein [Candidatus Woesebacteria bacterium GW2011_GWB1_38_5b]